MYLLRGGARSAAGGPSAGLLTGPFRGLAHLAGRDNPRHTLKTTGGTEMQQLTGMDASFLALETATTTGHVGGLSVLSTLVLLPSR
jgi:hypothetical protein